MIILFSGLNSRLIINDCLDSGTQLPFIDWGIKEGYGVIVANTNYNTANDSKDGEEIRVRTKAALS